MEGKQQQFWQISLFGGLEARCGEQSLTRFKTKRAAILLARLACFPDRPQSREVLTEELWAEDDPDAARLRFRQTLKLLRQELEPEGAESGSVLVTDRFSVKLNRDAFTTDVAAFESALSSAARAETHERRQELLERAVTIYRGELLPGFYEDWAVRERDRLAERQRQALEQLETLLTETGKIHEAVVYARQVVLADPYREESHQRLIQLYAQTGRIGEAHRQYRELERLLRDEMNAPPSDATVTLMERLPPAPVASSPPRPSSHAVVALPALTSVPEEPQTAAPTLPVPTTRFFGREDEIAPLAALLMPRVAPPAPLVTLLGNGGAGKTRLALEIVPTLREWYGGAVWFVSLAEVSDASRLLDTVAEAMGLPRSADIPIAEQVTAKLLTYSHALLILDNFETVGHEGNAIVQNLRRTVLGLACLVTSRQRLNIAGEKAYPVKPLPTPRSAGTPERLLEFPSVQLFVDRAQDARLSFALTPENAGTVAELCHTLEGIPLALELAAAWSAVLTPAQILARLTRRFDLLVSRKEDTIERHRSLQAVLEGSFQTLPKSAQRLFAHLSIFRGGWTLDAAEAVCTDAELSADTILDGLSLLADRSFVWFEEQGETMRCQQLETLREFGAEQLMPDEKSALSTRLFTHFLTQAEATQAKIRTAEEKAAIDTLETERDNLRAALTWAVDSDAMEGLRLLNVMANVWTVRGYIVEGRSWAERFLLATQGITPERAETLTNAALFAWYQGDYEAAIGFARRSLEARQELGDSAGMAASFNTIAMSAMEMGQITEAEAGFRESLTLHRALGNARGVSVQTVNLGGVAYYRGDYALSCELYEDALAQRRALGDQRGIASALDFLGRSKRELGEYAHARALHEESLALRRTLEDKSGIAFCLTRLGTALICLEQYQRALLVLEEACDHWKQLGDPSGMVEAQYHQGKAYERLGDEDTARTLWQDALRFRHQHNELPSISEVLEALAGLPLPDNSHIRAVRWLGSATSLREAIGFPVRASAFPVYNHTLTTLKNSVGDLAFAAAWDEGRTASCEEIVQDALA